MPGNLNSWHKNCKKESGKIDTDPARKRQKKLSTRIAVGRIKFDLWRSTELVKGKRFSCTGCTIPERCCGCIGLCVNSRLINKAGGLTARTRAVL